MTTFVPAADYGVALDAVKQAHDQIATHIHQTPVMTSASLDKVADCNLYFKCENFQKTGSFKVRGVMNTILNTQPKAVVAHSSGNHGIALSYAAQAAKIPAYIVMPTISPLCKQEAVSSYGGQLTMCEPSISSRVSTAEALCTKYDATLIHSYNNPNVIAGQGTVALELMDQVKDLDIIVVSIGGGGLISGTCIAAKGLNPDIKIIAAEPAAADDAFRSKLAGELVGNDTYPDTFAEGLKMDLGSYTWPIVRDLVDEIMLVEEGDIVPAMELVWQRLKCVIEPSAAVAVAVALSPAFKEKYGRGKNVGVILCGGNVDFSINCAKAKPVFTSSS